MASWFELFWTAVTILPLHLLMRVFGTFLFSIGKLFFWSLMCLLHLLVAFVGTLFSIIKSSFWSFMSLLHLLMTFLGTFFFSLKKLFSFFFSRKKLFFWSLMSLTMALPGVIFIPFPFFFLLLPSVIFVLCFCCCCCCFSSWIEFMMYIFSNRYVRCAAMAAWTRSRVNK